LELRDAQWFVNRAQQEGDFVIGAGVPDSDIPPVMVGGIPTHIVKSWSMFYNDIITGQRTSDIRKTTDRRFKVGDQMLLREWDPVKGEYTDRQRLVVITYIQTNKSNPCAISPESLADDTAVLSIKLVR